MDLETFRQMCREHDLTYQYSDDGGVWSRGSASEARVRAAAKQLPREDAVRIWNEVVDEKLVPDARGSFYWRT